MPFSTVLPLTFFVLVALVCSQRQFGDSRALRREFDLGIFAEITEQSNFVYAFSCHKSSLNLGQWDLGQWSDFDKYISFDAGRRKNASCEFRIGTRTSCIISSVPLILLFPS